jgi:hypothetical protein
VTKKSFVDVIADADGQPAEVALDLARAANDALLEARDNKARAAAEVVDRWAPVIDRLELLAWLQASMRDRFTAEILRPLVAKREAADTDKPPPNSDRVLALGELAHRAALCTEEILELLKAGLPAGAFVRWRTLHEVCVIAGFLHDHGDEEAVRWRDHERFEVRSDARAYNIWARQNDVQRLSEGELEEFETLNVELRERYGPEFVSDYGWAHEALLADGRGYKRARDRGDRPKGPSFLDLCVSTQLDTQHLLYRIASHLVHGGDSSIITHEQQPDALATGAMTSGVDWVAPRVAHSFQLATAFYVLSHPEPPDGPDPELQRAQAVSDELALLVREASDAVTNADPKDTESSE